MKFLFDFFPIVLFYTVFKFYKSEIGEVQAMIYATSALIVATVLQVAYTWLRNKKIEKMHVVVLGLALVFGGATIYFQEPIYLIWKVTIANWIFALAFLGSHFIGQTPLIKRMLQHAIALPEVIWTRLSYMCIAFFFSLGIINLAVAYNVSFDAWTDFKMFGMLGLSASFFIFLAFYMSRHMITSEADG